MNRLTKRKLWEILGIIAFVATSAFSLWIFLAPEAQSGVILFLQDTNWFIASAIIVLLSFIATVAAPTSTILIIYALIAVWDWRMILVASLLGDTLGASTAFTIARYFQDKVYNYLPWLAKFSDWESRLNNSNKLIHLTFLRFATLYAGDYISYIAGLTKIKFMEFLISTVIANSIFKVIIFYTLNKGIRNDQYFLIAGALIGSSVLLWSAFILYERTVNKRRSSLTKNKP